MKNVALKILMIFVIAAFASSCKNRVVDVKSPCVSTEDGPCGQKKPINDWWLKHSKKS